LKGRTRLTPLLSVFFLILLLGLVALPLASAEWPMYHSDASHSGVGAGNSTVSSALLWKHGTANQIWSSPAVVGDFVYIGSSDGSVYALNASTGSTVWTFATGGEVRSSPAVVGGTVYFGSMDDKVYALSASTGSLIWSYTTGNDTDSSPAVFGGIVYIGSLDGKVYALNATSGFLVWSYTTGSVVVSSPAVAGGLVYIGSMDRSLYALNASTGAFVWSYPTGGGIYGPPAVVGGVVYVGSWDYSVYALNASSGVRQWSFATADYANPCPAVDGATVYVGSRDGKVYALNASTGGLIWTYTTGNTIGSSPAVVAGVVYIGSTDSKLYALNASTGAVIWSYLAGGPIVTSPAVVGGVVYFGSWDGSVYALGGPSSAGILQQVWVPQPLNAVEAIGLTAVALGAVSIVVSFVSNPLSVAGEQVGAKTEDMVPDDLKRWLEDVISSKQKTDVAKAGGSPLRPTKPEVLAYGTSIVLLAIGFSYVKVSSLDQIWTLLPIFFGTSILVGLVQKYVSIVFLRRRGVWSEHRIWPLGFILFLLTTFAFRVPFSSPTRSAHQSTEATERLVARAGALEILIGLAFGGLFLLLLVGGYAAIGGAGLSMCVIGSLSGTFPVAPMSGKDIYDYNRRRWAGLFVIVVLVFCAWLFLL
jgi:outer membrane protein assembly factor BamB